MIKQYTQGICGDGSVILCDGVPVSIDEVIEKLNQYEASIDTLKTIKAVQISDGNWNYDPYMHGMANALILAESFFEKKASVDFLEAPDKWLCDKMIDKKIEAICESD